MAKNGGQITFGIKFEADSSGLEKIKKSFQELRNLTPSDLLKINPSFEGDMNKARKAWMEIRNTVGEVERAVDNSFNRTVNFIRIYPNKEYRLRANGTTNGRVFYYDENKVYISTQLNENRLTNIPSNAKYLKFRIGTDILNNGQEIQLEEGSVATALCSSLPCSTHMRRTFPSRNICYPFLNQPSRYRNQSIPCASGFLPQ